ncbi:MAG TPA: hypothetical protein VGO90_02415 [Chthoniobacteraceae bacterium]|jgi:hypothetical protein|nr:hypothetical protein [Chthoniobacter sp.]HEV7866506.1 hypothetical protein [Chthoniobacteraceae bacterium]
MQIRRFISLLVSLFTCGFFAGCQAVDSSDRNSRAAMVDAIKREPAGDYFIGRRYYKVDYKFWGWVRKPGQPWSAAKMVMMNEHQKLAPDRQLGKLGSDNNYEYRLFGYFSGETVYEPASNGFYPEFVLKNYELQSVTPANIFRGVGATDPRKRVIAQPY